MTGQTTTIAKHVGALLLGAALLCSSPAAAQERWKDPENALSAYREGRYGDALDATESLLARCEAARPKADECMTLLLSATNLAAFSGQLQKSERHGRRAVEVAEQSLPADHADTATAYLNLATTLNRLERHRDALPLIRRALELRRSAWPAGHPYIGVVIIALSDTLEKLNEPKEAEGYLREALALYRTAYADSHDAVTAVLDRLASNLERQGKLDEAEATYRESVALTEQNPDATAYSLRTSYNNLALVLKYNGKPAEAVQFYRKAMALLKDARPDDPGRAIVSTNLATALVDTRSNLDEARTLLRSAQRAVLEQVASETEFDATAAQSLRHNRIAFAYGVQAAWLLSDRAKKRSGPN